MIRSCDSCKKVDEVKRVNWIKELGDPETLSWFCFECFDKIPDKPKAVR